MAKCIYCGSDTYLFSGGIPMCILCLNDLDAGRKPEFIEPPTPPKNGVPSPEYPVKVKRTKGGP